jgi:hypothetical protein
MYRRRVALTSAILGILLLGCGQAHDRVNAQVATPAADVTPATPASLAPSSTTPASPTTVVAPPAAEPAPAPAAEPAPAAAAETAQVAAAPIPAIASPPASVTVKYTAHDGGKATATLVETGAIRSLASGSAVFAGLADGAYTVQVQVVYPVETSSNTGIGAETVYRAHRIAVQSGDQAVLVCNDTDCTGIA